MSLDISVQVDKMTSDAGSALTPSSTCVVASRTTESYVWTAGLDKACFLASATDSKKFVYDVAANDLSFSNLQSVTAETVTNAANRVQTAFNNVSPTAGVADMLPVVQAMCTELFVWAVSAGNATKQTSFRDVCKAVEPAFDTAFLTRTRQDTRSFDTWKTMWKGQCEAMVNLDLMAAQLTLDETQVQKKTAIMARILYWTWSPYFLYTYYLAVLATPKNDFYSARCCTLACWLTFVHTYTYFNGIVGVKDNFADLLTHVGSALQTEDSGPSPGTDAKDMSDKNTSVTDKMKKTNSLLSAQRNRLVMVQRRVNAARASRRKNLIAMCVWAAVAVVLVAALAAVATQSPAFALALCIAITIAVLSVWIRQKSILGTS